MSAGYAGRVAPMSTAIGVLGITGYTAYFGMELGQPKPGDRILVSAPSAVSARRWGRSPASGAAADRRDLRRP
jgi:hypothetical protein